MKRLFSTLLLLLGLIAPSFGAAVLNTAFVSTGISIANSNNTGNAFKFASPASIGNGDCLVLKLTYPDGATLSSISGTTSGTWSTTAAVTASGGAGNNDTAIFLRASPASGADTITITFSAVQQPVMWTFEDWVGVGCTSQGTSQSANLTSTGGTTAIGPGSFTPTNNNGTGGNLLLAFFDFSGGGSSSSNPTSWSAGASFTLHDADIAGTNNQGLPKASEYFTQTSSAAINPQITPNGDSADSFNAVAVALAISNGTGTTPATFRVVGFTELFDGTLSATSIALQFPTLGNLAVFTCTQPSGSIGFTSVTDSNSNTWTNETQNTVSVQLYFQGNATPTPGLVVTGHLSASPGQSVAIGFYDIAGAATSPLGAVGSTTSTNISTGVTSIADQPDITPVSTNSIVIGLLNNGTGPTTAVTSPSAFSDIVTFTGVNDSSSYSFGDGWAHYLNSSLTAESWTWTIASCTGVNCNSVASTAVEFKAAPAGTSCPALALLGVGC